MKLITLEILLLGAVLLTGPTDAGARTSGDEKNLTTAMTQLDKAAGSPQKEQAVSDVIARTFNVPAERVKGLRARNIGFGEIAATLAMASGLEGGVTEANVNKVADLRHGHAGWVQIARAFNIDLASASRKVGSAERSARDLFRRAQAEMSGSGAGGRSQRS